MFIPAFIMGDPLRSLFMPLTLGVGFAMISSYLLSSTFVPILCVTLLKHMGHARRGSAGCSTGSSRSIGKVVGWFVRLRWVVVPAYLAACGLILWLLGLQVGTELFPQIDSGQFVLRFRPPPGSNFELTRQMAVKCLEEIEREAKPENIEITMGYVGQVAPNFGIDNMVLFMRGPDDGQLRVALREDERDQARRVPRAAPQGPARAGDPLAGRAAGAGRAVQGGGGAASQDGDLRLRAGRYRDQRHELRLADADRGPRRRHRSEAGPAARGEDRRRDEAASRSSATSSSSRRSTTPPSRSTIDREKAGLSGAKVEDVAHALVMATASTRFANLNYWVDVKTGFDYLVQIQVPPLRMEKPEDIETLPLESVNPLVNLMVRDVATVRQGRAARRARPRHVAALPDPDRERRGRGHGPGLAPGRPGDRRRRRRRPAACGSSPWASSRR